MDSLKLRQGLFILCILGLGTSPLAADVGAEQVDALFADWTGPATPGCAVGVIRDGEWVHRAGYGSANLDYGIPLASDSVFRIASLSKQFTAMVVLLLVEEGKLALDDEVRRYLPELPARQPPVRLRHLLEHTGGYREYLDLMQLAGKGDEDRYPAAEALAMVARQKEHNFAPGERQLISDTGYFLLSFVVERAAGRCLRDYAAEKIFQPLGMHETRFQDDHTEIVRNRVTGYAPRPDGGFRVSSTQVDIVGDGGIYTSVDDLFLWDRNFDRPTVGSEEILAQMTSPAVTVASGETIHHGYGLVARHYRGLREVSHGGAFVGFRSFMARFPDQRLTVVCLCNRSDSRPWDLVARIADLYLADQLAPLVPGPVDAAELAALAGAYRNPFMGWTVELEPDDGKLAASFFLSGAKRLYVPLRRHWFVREDSPMSRLEVVAGEDGLRIRVWAVSENMTVYEPFERVTLGDAAEYAGTYRCPEVPVDLTLVADQGRLLWQLDSSQPTVFRPTIRDSFLATNLWSLDFLRDGDGRVTGLRLGASRARNILCLRRPGVE